MQKFKHFLRGGQPFEVYTDHAVLKTLMTHENPSPRRARWIEKMASFNFTIHYRPGVNMGHADFASRMDTFLPKDSTSESISTLRAQKQPEILLPKRRITPIIQPFNLIKKQKSNPMASLRKVEIIRRKKTHNGHYCQQCRIYYQGYKHRCPTPIPQPQSQPQPQPQPQPQQGGNFPGHSRRNNYSYSALQNRSRSLTTESEGGGWI